MGQIADFLKDVRTRVEALATFDQVWIAPFIDVERLLMIPRFPAAIIVDSGGEYDAFNGKIMVRQFSITVLDAHPRDHIGEETSLALLDLGETLMGALEYDTDIDIFNAGDSDLEALGTDTGILILAKTYKFTATYERA